MSDIERLRALSAEWRKAASCLDARHWPGPEPQHLARAEQYRSCADQLDEAMTALLADYERLRGMEERVKGAVVRELHVCCGHFEVGSDYDEELEPLCGQTVALVPVPGGE
jgi:hypothetical protein